MKIKNNNMFFYLAMANLVCMLTSNIAAFKIINISEISLTGGTLVFPLSYILGDVFAEVYGYRITKNIMLISFLCNAFMVGVFQVAILMPYPNYFLGQEAFKTVLGTTPRLFVAGVIAYLVGSLSNAFIMEYIKYNSKIKFLWFRTIFSTIIGEGLDTTIFLFIGFWGTMQLKNIFSMILSQAIVKIIYEVICTPITYKVIRIVETKEKGGLIV